MAKKPAQPEILVWNDYKVYRPVSIRGINFLVVPLYQNAWRLFSSLDSLINKAKGKRGGVSMKFDFGNSCYRFFNISEETELDVSAPMSALNIVKFSKSILSEYAPKIESALGLGPGLKPRIEIYYTDNPSGPEMLHDSAVVLYNSHPITPNADGKPTWPLLSNNQKYYAIGKHFGTQDLERVEGFPYMSIWLLWE